MLPRLYERPTNRPERTGLDSQKQARLLGALLHLAMPTQRKISRSGWISHSLSNNGYAMLNLDSRMT